MLTETQAQIYLAGQRGTFQSEGFRSLRTLNYEQYQAAGREAVGALEVCNDETLSPGQSCGFSVSQAGCIVLLPLVGGLEVEAGGMEPEYVSPGEVLSFEAHPGKHYAVTNPYSGHTVNYLRLHFAPARQDLILGQFDLSAANVLHPIWTGGASQIFIGKYDGREEGLFIPTNPGQPIFTFIIEGAFEVQNRLLENRDALSVWNTPELEFEALSEEAVVLVVAL